eukprot:3163112-Amphidinium_carterae.1
MGVVLAAQKYIIRSVPFHALFNAERALLLAQVHLAVLSCFTDDAQGPQILYCMKRHERSGCSCNYSVL